MNSKAILENYFRGTENVHQGLENYFRGTENVHQGLENYFLGTENVHQGLENYFRERKMFIRAWKIIFGDTSYYFIVFWKSFANLFQPNFYWDCVGHVFRNAIVYAMFPFATC